MAQDSSDKGHPLTRERLEAIKGMLGRATPGPWESFVEGRDMLGGSSCIRTAGEDIYLSGASDADQDFIASARQDVAELLAEIERLNWLLERQG